MESLPDSMVKSPVQIRKKKTRLEELEEMRTQCLASWDIEYARYISGEKNLPILILLEGRQLIIDRDWRNEGYRLIEEKCFKEYMRQLQLQSQGE